jgi:ribosome-binding protein aMBF1 (putative translation factor)
MTAISELHKQWLDRPKYKKLFMDKKAEHELAQKLIQARINSGLSQQVIAKKMEITLSSLLRIESLLVYSFYLNNTVLHKLESS